MRIRFVLVFLLAIAIGFGAYFLMHRYAYDYIERVYTSEENRKIRELSYVEDLQNFVNINEISNETTSKLSEWARENKYVYLIIYKGSELFFTTDDLLSQPSEEEEPEETPEETPEDTPEETPEQTPEETPEETPEQTPEQTPEETPEETPEQTPEETPGEEQKENQDGDKESVDNSSDKTDSDKTDSDKTDKEDKPTYKEPSGVTIRYPSREELFEYAKKNDMHLVTLTDKSELLVSLTEFTEYLYYDVSNITSVIAAVLVVLIILVVYSQLVTTRIIRLGNEVNKVAYGDVSHKIKSRGNDEISRLSRNVDNMRESIIENFEKEREALEANSALITSMSHDIRTPLTVLLGYIDVMQNKASGDTEMLGYLKAAESTAMRLKKLSDDMFGYFLVFGGKELEIEKESYDAATLIEQMLLEHITLMRERGETVEFSDVDYDAFLHTEVHTDAPKLMRIFDNVFSNVNKYSDKTVPVKIDVTREENEMKVKIENTISKIQEKVESNGIGLKTCKKLGEYIDVGFECEEKEKTFVAQITLKLYKTSQKEN